MYDSLNVQLSPMCFQPVFEEMNVNNFGRIIAYLALVYRLSDFCDEETIQETVRRTVEAFRLVDSSGRLVPRQRQRESEKNELVT